MSRASENDTTRLPSRRGLIGAAAAVIAVGPASLAVAAPHPDAALFALESGIATAEASARMMSRAVDALETQCYAEAGLPPEKPSLSPEVEGYPAAMSLYRAAVQARAARLAEAEMRLGLESARDAYEQADRRLLMACRDLAELPAKTLDGLILKARLSAHDGSEDGHLVPSIVADLLAMGPGAVRPLPSGNRRA